ncbi:MAG: DnaD domain protein [Bacilli bacterium]|nr:DnaD domain protein [Bacilli bacterium]MDD4733427.1 DnaD domain protein [Bacilli bacterium]
MLNKVIELMKDKVYNVPSKLLFNYKKLNITEKELILLIYFVNNDRIFNSSLIKDEMNMEISEILAIIDSLNRKGLAKIEVIKKDNKMIEYINIDDLYQKLSFIIINKKDEDTSNIYEIFEQEFGRTLSPLEYEKIADWKDKKFSEEIILLALKEAIYNGVTNLRYIDTILYEWRKKGINSEKDIKIKREKTEKKELFDYDWLNEDE